MFMTLHTNVIVVTIGISIADLIGGGGNTDVCPGRQTPSRRLWCSSLAPHFVPTPSAARKLYAVAKFHAAGPP